MYFPIKVWYRIAAFNVPLDTLIIGRSGDDLPSQSHTTTTGAKAESKQIKLQPSKNTET